MGCLISILIPLVYTFVVFSMGRSVVDKTYREYLFEKNLWADYLKWLEKESLK